MRFFSAALRQLRTYSPNFPKQFSPNFEGSPAQRELYLGE
jgi:hypothetical protein